MILSERHRPNDRHNLVDPWLSTQAPCSMIQGKFVVRDTGFKPGVSPGKVLEC